MRQISDRISKSPKTPFLLMCRIRKCTCAMKNGLLLLFVAIIVSLTACSSEKHSSLEQEVVQQTQQQFATESLEIAEEPEFMIEADYDPALAEKAEENKRNKTEETSPIALTSDDDDLVEDRDDLPTKVMTRSIKAYDYNDDEFINDSENNVKGGSRKAVTPKENEKALFFVIAGAYKDSKEAEKKSKAITKLGYKVELITFDQNFKTVCVAKLENRSQADLLAKALKAEKIDAYVVKRRR